MNAPRGAGDTSWRVLMQSRLIEESIERVRLLADAVGATSPASLQEFVDESKEFGRLLTEHGESVDSAVEVLSGVNLQLRDLFDQIARAREELHTYDQTVVAARDHRAIAMIAHDRSSAFGQQTQEALDRLRAELT